MSIWKRRRPSGEKLLPVPCPQCGHEEAVHPWPGRKDLKVCAFCIWEEDTGQRATEATCERRLPVVDR